MNATTVVEGGRQNNLLRRILRVVSFYSKKHGKWGLWIWANMKLSDLPLVGRFFTWLAGWAVGPFESKYRLARIKTYVSPKAQVSCPDLSIGPHCFVDDFVTIYGEQGSSIVLDSRVCVNRGTIIEAKSAGKVTIGEHGYIGPYCILYGILGNLHIGRNALIAAYCSFISAQHETRDLSQPMRKQGLTTKGDIIIEDDVWIGMGARIMDGVRIGQGAIIGANAVVTKDIPPYSVAVGVPARVVRKRDESTLSGLVQGGHLTQTEDVAAEAINALSLPKSAEATDINIRPMIK